MKAWPGLDYSAAADTYRTLHLWTQIMGKLRLQLMPWFNHSWHLTLRLTPAGLHTDLMPVHDGHIDLLMDLHAQQLVLTHSDGRRVARSLLDLSVAAAYRWLFAALEAWGIFVRIDPRPNELTDVPLLSEDETPRHYVPDHARAWYRALLDSWNVLTRFRAGYRGKCSPVHFFWGSFDLAVTRFSGRPAPLHPGGIPALPDWVAQEAYSHEVSSVGFWPGDPAHPEAYYYAYCYPEPTGFPDADVQPAAAHYDTGLGEYLLPYEAVRRSGQPAETLLAFCETTYRAGADLASWSRAELEGGLADFIARRQRNRQSD